MHLSGRRAFQAEEQPVQTPCGMSMLSILEETARRLICLGGVSQREGSRRGQREMEAAAEVFVIHCKESITETNSYNSFFKLYNYNSFSCFLTYRQYLLTFYFVRGTRVVLSQHFHMH